MTVDYDVFPYVEAKIFFFQIHRNSQSMQKGSLDFIQVHLIYVQRFTTMYLNFFPIASRKIMWQQSALY